MNRLQMLAVPLLLLLLSPAASADDHGGGGYRKFQEEFRDGGCKVKRKQETNGEYEEERKCPAARRGGPYEAFQEEYQEGGCLVKRKQTTKGEFEEERKCKPSSRSRYRSERFHAEPVYVPSSPPTGADPEITIQGTVKVR